MADGGYRSMAAPWIGGASSTPAAAQGGYRSMMAFWIGGACDPTDVPPPTPGDAEPTGYIVYCGRMMNRRGG